MSSLTATNIPRPADHQAFERASAVLLECMLNDPNVQLSGRNGQSQSGVDIFGIRSGTPDQHVGVQCKCKSLGKQVTIPELNKEVEMAKKVIPELSEFFIFTTSPSDVTIQKEARKITSELAKSGRHLKVYVWGWNELENRILRFREAINAFDPGHTPHGECLQNQMNLNTKKLDEIRSMVGVMGTRAFPSSPPEDKFFDEEIDRYREVFKEGKFNSAKLLFEEMLHRVKGNCSDRVHFRISANIGHCLIALGRPQEGRKAIDEAIELAPDDPKAVYNRGYLIAESGNWKECFEFSVEKLKAFPDHAGLANLVIQAARFDGLEDDPLKHIPIALRETEEVETAYAIFLRAKGKKDSSLDEFMKLKSKYPENKLIKRIHAEAVIDNIIASDDFRYFQGPSSSDLPRLKEASQDLMDTWNDFISSDAAGNLDEISLCHNACLGLHLLGKHKEAVDLVSKGIDQFGNDKGLIKRGISVGIDAKNKKFVERLFQLADDSPETAILIVRFYAEAGQWKKLVDFVARQKSNIPQSELRPVEALYAIGQYWVESQGKKGRSVLEGIVKEFSDNARALISVAYTARSAGFRKIAQSAFKIALELCKQTNELPDIIMTASFANDEEDYETVISLLSDRINYDQDSTELRALARAYANLLPISEQAKGFFDNLQSDVRQIDFYKTHEGLLFFYLRDFEQAEEKFSEAMKDDPSLNNLLPLLTLAQRNDDSERAEQILREIDEYEVSGSPTQKIILAQYLMYFGETDRAINFGYRLIRKYHSDHDVSLKFVGLLSPMMCNTPLPSMSEIGPDTWFKIQNDNGRTVNYIIENDEELSGVDTIPTDSDLAQIVFGKVVGDKFHGSVGNGVETEWVVLDIRHKISHIYGETLVGFEGKFPGRSGVELFEVVEGDMSPFLKKIEDWSNRLDEVISFHSEQFFPQVGIAKRLNSTHVEVCHQIISRGGIIRACIGTNIERKEAALLYNDKNGVVLDEYSAFLVAELGAFDVIKEVFGNIYFPRGCFENISSLKKKHGSNLPSPTLSLIWQDGKPYRADLSPDEIEVNLEFLERVLDIIENSCELCSVLAPDLAPSMIKNLLLIGGASAADSLNLAHSKNAVLISEDVAYRLIGSESYKIKGLWLQEVFAYALGNNVISHDRYLDIIIALSARRHEFLTTTGNDFIRLHERMKDDRHEEFKLLARNIGGRQADIISHVHVVNSFINKTWSGIHDASIINKKLSGILLDNLIKGRPDDWYMIIAYLLTISKSLFCGYVLKYWLPGHFLDVRMVSEAINGILRNDQ